MEYMASEAFISTNVNIYLFPLMDYFSKLLVLPELQYAEE